MTRITWEARHEIDHSFSMWPRFITDLAADVYEVQGMVVVNITLPGVTADAVTVVIEDTVLTVTGTRSEESATDTKDFFTKEIHRGSFTRSVQLPRPVDVTGAVAAFSNGILQVRVPVKPGATHTTFTVPIMV